MKKLIILFGIILFGIIGCKAQTLYTIYPGKMYCTPSVPFVQVKDTLEYEIIVDKSWSQLYSNTNRSTHKLSGVGDLFGFNSLRLGDRAAPKDTNGVIAVAYMHIDGSIYPYKDGHPNPPAMRDTITHKNLVLQFDSTYTCKYVRLPIGWKISIYKRNIWLSTYQTPVIITNNKYTQQVYVELGDKVPSPWKLLTYIKFTKIK